MQNGLKEPLQDDNLNIEIEFTDETSSTNSQRLNMLQELSQMNSFSDFNESKTQNSVQNNAQNNDHNKIRNNTRNSVYNSTVYDDGNHDNHDYHDSNIHSMHDDKDLECDINDNIKDDNDDDNHSEHKSINGQKANSDMSDNADDIVDDIVDDVAESKDTRVESKVSKRPKVKRKQVGPGRPRKNPKKEPIPKNGIVKTPRYPDSNIEFMYDNPLIIKKIIAFFKSVAAQKIQLLFRPTDVILYAMDHHAKSHIRVRIDASKINHYYCGATLDIGIPQKDLEMVLNVVDKDYNSIVLLSNKENMQKSLMIVLENSMEIDETQTIDLIGQYDHMENESKFTNEAYMIYWQWSGKYFKKCINDIKMMSEQFAIIQEHCDKNLMFSHTSTNKKIHKHYIVKNKNKVHLKSKLLGDDSFRVDMKVEYIRPISSAHIADEIVVLVDENKPLMTKAYIDNGAIEIKTLTEIIDDRPDL